MRQHWRAWKEFLIAVLAALPVALPVALPQ
jgi:hypothetical protein